MYRSSKSLMALAIAGFFTFVSNVAYALPESCNEFQKLVEPRNAIMAQLTNTAQSKKRPTAAQACATVSRLVLAEKKISDWMTTNKDWCQIPDQEIEGFSKANAQSKEFKVKACNAASQQAKQIAQMKRAQAQQRAAQGAGQSAPGSGVQLPKGAL